PLRVPYSRPVSSLDRGHCRRSLPLLTGGTMRTRMLLAPALVAGALAALALAAQAAMSPVVSAKLVGKVEVPKGSPTGSGIAVLHLNAKKGTVCWTFEQVKRIDKPLAADIQT